MKRIGIALIALLALAWIAVEIGFVGGLVEPRINRLVPHAPYAVSEETKALHASLLVADLHADTLLWSRDPLDRADRGHVDLPRLVEGNVGIQVFGVVTKSPEGQNYESNTGESDNITTLAIAQGWPVRTWGSLYERALHQASRLRAAEERAPDRLRILRTRGDLEAVLEARAGGSTIVGGLLETEGAHPLEGDLDKLQGLWDAGFRMIGLHHFFDNELGGSLHGTSKAGLSEFGRSVVLDLERRGMIIDVAHSSEAVVEEVLALTRRPFIVSHTGVKGACDSARNISDALMKRIALRGGVVGIGYWDGAVCDPAPESVVRSIRYAVDLLGADHVALGSDFDGATEVAFDTSELAVLTEQMRQTGFTRREIEQVMGRNVERILLALLPAGSEG
ncbi:MAG: dipeptidase [Myxococcales bacterium]|nr:dipeptidase [Myxococcales bacterium]